MNTASKTTHACQNGSLMRLRHRIGSHLAVWMLLPLFFIAVIPRGYMFSQSRGAGESITLSVVFCSLQGIENRLLTLEPDAPAVPHQSNGAHCAFALLTAALLPSVTVFALPPTFYSQRRSHHTIALPPSLPLLHAAPRGPPLFTQ